MIKDFKLFERRKWDVIICDEAQNLKNKDSKSNKNIQNILSMYWKEVGPSQEWIRIRKWDFDSFPDVTTWGVYPHNTLELLRITD